MCVALMAWHIRTQTRYALISFRLLREKLRNSLDFNGKSSHKDICNYLKFICTNKN